MRTREWPTSDFDCCDGSAVTPVSRRRRSKRRRADILGVFIMVFAMSVDFVACLSLAILATISGKTFRRFECPEED